MIYINIVIDLLIFNDLGITGGFCLLTFYLGFCISIHKWAWSVGFLFLYVIFVEFL